MALVAEKFTAERLKKKCCGLYDIYGEVADNDWKAKTKKWYTVRSKAVYSWKSIH